MTMAPYGRQTLRQMQVELLGVFSSEKHLNFNEECQRCGVKNSLLLLFACNLVFPCRIRFQHSASSEDGKSGCCA